MGFLLDCGFLDFFKTLNLGQRSSTQCGDTNVVPVRVQERVNCVYHVSKTGREQCKIFKGVLLNESQEFPYLGLLRKLI